jgi:hypothetical protein
MQDTQLGRRRGVLAAQLLDVGVLAADESIQPGA